MFKKRKKYLQIQSNTQNPYLKQRPNINTIIAKLDINNNNKPKPKIEFKSVFCVL